ncbi:MAG: hypothetical protein HQL01_07665 [Nitrospirae bacterium]|nr:hypothetical protein [Nitrospirota bacterium]
MAKKEVSTVTKRRFFICVAQDIDHPMRWCLKNDFKSLVTIKVFKTPNDLKKAMKDGETCDYLILDSVVCDPIEKFAGEFFIGFNAVKIMAIVPPEITAVALNALSATKEIKDIIKRPFTPEGLQQCIFETFGFKKPKEINVFELKKGMVLSENVTSPGGEALIECGVVLNDMEIAKLVKYNIQRVTVHTDMTAVLNCWEFKKCGQLGRCPASVFVDADGFLGGVNAGRGCMFVKDTLLQHELIKDKSFGEKLTLICSKCEFCKIVASESKGAVSHTLFVEHIKANKGRKKQEGIVMKDPEIN